MTKRSDDHIKAKTAIGLMDLLGIKDNRTASVALIQNARSRKSASGRKDIIKVEGDASWLNRAGLYPGHQRDIENGNRERQPRCISSIEEDVSSNGK